MRRSWQLCQNQQIMGGKPRLGIYLCDSFISQRLEWGRAPLPKFIKPLTKVYSFLNADLPSVLLWATPCSACFWELLPEMAKCISCSRASVQMQEVQGWTTETCRCFWKCSVHAAHEVCVETGSCSLHCIIHCILHTSPSIWLLDLPSFAPDVTSTSSPLPFNILFW